MNFFDKLEKRIGRFAISNLMLYLIIVYVIGFIILRVNPELYIDYLSLNAKEILSGQVWRIVTYLCFPPSTDLLYMALYTIIFYSLGTSLERMWGAFRFNVFIFLGVIGNVIAALVIYLAFDQIMLITASELYLSMLLAMAATIPNASFYLFFILPVKAKWFGFFYGVVIAFDVISAIMSGNWPSAIAVIMSIFNFIIFYIFLRKKSWANAMGFGRTTTQKNFKKQMDESKKEQPASKPVVRHRCSVCGITDLDAPDMVFRYCSKCDGEHEYCSEHLYTHEHIHKEN